MSSSLIRKQFLSLKLSYLNKLVDIYHNYSISNSLQVDTFRNEYMLWDLSYCTMTEMVVMAFFFVQSLQMVLEGSKSYQEVQGIAPWKTSCCCCCCFITWLSETRKVEIMQLKSEAFAIDNNLWYIVIDTAILVGEAVSKEPRGCIMTLNVVLITKAALARKLFQ